MSLQGDNLVVYLAVFPLYVTRGEWNAHIELIKKLNLKLKVSFWVFEITLQIQDKCPSIFKLLLMFVRRTITDDNQAFQAYSTPSLPEKNKCIRFYPPKVINTLDSNVIFLSYIYSMLRLSNVTAVIVSLCTCRITSVYIIGLWFYTLLNKVERAMLVFFRFSFFVNIFCYFHIYIINFKLITSACILSSVHYQNAFHLYSMWVAYKVNVCKTENRALSIRP